MNRHAVVCVAAPILRWLQWPLPMGGEATREQMRTILKMHLADNALTGEYKREHRLGCCVPSVVLEDFLEFDCTSKGSFSVA